MEPIVFRHKEIETMPQEALKALQKQKLQKTLEAALKTPFYKERLNGVGITRAEDVQTEADFQKIPYTTKHDLREAFPCGMLAADKADVVRMHASSGTTGVPTVVYLTQADLDKAAELNARSCACTGSTRNDVFQNMMTYGLFTGGLMLHYGAERLGMMVIPAGSGNTRRQLQLMKDFRTTVIHATPSYMLHMYDKMAEEGFSLSDFAVKKAYIGAEPHSEDIRRKIESLYGIDAYNSYGLSEMNGPGLAFECIYKNGMHLWEDSYIGEIIDPQTLEPLPDGERGELVLTILERNGMPILRYRTRDLTRFIPEPCPCGRTHRRLERMTGRSDDMLIINGVRSLPTIPAIWKICKSGFNPTCRRSSSSARRWNCTNREHSPSAGAKRCASSTNAKKTEPTEKRRTADCSAVFLYRTRSIVDRSYAKKGTVSGG